MSEDTPGGWIAKFQETLTELVVRVAELTTSISVKDQHRSLKDEEYERRLQNHGDRIRDLETKLAARDDHGAQIAELKETLNAVEAAVNKSAWIPVLVTGVLVSVIAGITIAVITKSLG
jgi:uncharacterized coiled-coil protein SlyX